MQYEKPLIDKIRAGVKYILKSSSVGKFFYPFIQTIWRKFAVPARIRRLHRVGYQVLADMHEVFTKNGIPYYCDAGTLLGFVRDGGFIKHDDDIDVGIVPETIPLRTVLKAFIDAGWGYVHGFDYNGRFLEFTVKHRLGVTIDVFLHEYCNEEKTMLEELFLRWFPDRVYPSENANTALKFHFLGPKGLETIQVHGVEVSVPKNAREMLTSEYGPWEKPDPNFKSDQIQHEEMPGFVYRIPLEKALSL